MTIRSLLAATVVAAASIVAASDRASAATCVDTGVDPSSSYVIMAIARDLNNGSIFPGLNAGDCGLVSGAFVFGKTTSFLNTTFRPSSGTVSLILTLGFNDIGPQSVESNDFTGNNGFFYDIADGPFNFVATFQDGDDVYTLTVAGVHDETAGTITITSATVTGGVFGSGDAGGSAETAQTSSDVESAALSSGRAVIASTPDLPGRLDGPGAGALDVSASDAGGVASFDADLITMDLGRDRRLGVWARGTFSYFTDGSSATEVQGRVGTGQLGVDVAWSDRFAFGLMLHGDLTDQSSGAGEVDSLGVLVGPYAVVDLGSGLTFDALAALGRGFHTHTTASGLEADYESGRLYLSGRLSGDFGFGAWALRPSVHAAWYAERSEDFTDGDGGFVEGGTDSLGQLRFGPEVAYTFDLESGTIRPFVGWRGVWTWVDGRTDSGASDSAGGFSGAASGGFELRFGDVTGRAEVSLDGVGDGDYSAVTGALLLRAPLN